jgi:hypothetical protein
MAAIASSLEKVKWRYQSAQAMHSQIRVMGGYGMAAYTSWDEGHCRLQLRQTPLDPTRHHIQRRYP